MMMRVMVMRAMMMVVGWGYCLCLCSTDTDSHRWANMAVGQRTYLLTQLAER
jgi:hypothetical protein